MSADGSGAYVLRDNQVRSLLDMARKRAESAPEGTPLDLAAWPRVHRHYTDSDTCEHGEQLNVGWLEIGQEAENAQQLLDFAGVPDGHPQGSGDVDWRVAEVVLRLMDAQGYLSAIASAHARETAPGGMVGDYCIECERRWPCPTYLWADGQRDTLDCWEPADDEPQDAPAAQRLPHADVPGLTPDTCPERETHGKPFRYCPVKGCGWHEGMAQPTAASADEATP